MPMSKSDQNIVHGRTIIPAGADLPSDVVLAPRKGDEPRAKADTLLPGRVARPDEPSTEVKPESGDDGSDAALVVGTIQDVKDRVGDDLDLAKRALDAERNGENRSTLISHLVALVGEEEDE